MVDDYLALINQAPMQAYIISIAALIISLLALFISLNNRNKRKRLRREFEAHKTGSPKTSASGLETTYRNAISQSRARLKVAMDEITDLKEQHPGKEFKTQSKVFISSLEYLYAQYEKACQLYLDGKIDRAKFHDEFEGDLVNLIDKGEFSEKYFWTRIEEYPAILKVYKKFTGDDENETSDEVTIS